MILNAKLDPSSTQTPEEIEKYLRAAQEGSEVVIRNTQGRLLELKITTVTGTNPRAGRLYTEHGAGRGGCAWYAKSGKNCFHPTGQSTLVIPTDAVREYIATAGLPDFYTVTPGSHMF